MAIRKRMDMGTITAWVGLFYLVVVVLLCIGWVMNLINVVTSDTPIAEWTTVIIIQAVGIVVLPLGGVLGWFL